MGNHFLQDVIDEMQPESGVRPEILNYSRILLPLGIHWILSLGGGGVHFFLFVLGMWGFRKIFNIFIVNIDCNYAAIIFNIKGEH